MALQRCEDPDGRWAITVPAAWSRPPQGDAQSATDGMFLITPAADPARWADDPAVDLLAVLVIPSVTLPDWGEIWREILGDGDVTPVSERARSLDGQPADERIFDGVAEGVARRSRIACTSVGGALYMVSHVAATERYEAEERQVSAALDSFELLPGSAFAPQDDFDVDAHVSELIERDRAAHAGPPAEQPHEGFAHRLGSLLQRRPR